MHTFPNLSLPLIFVIVRDAPNRRPTSESFDSGKPSQHLRIPFYPFIPIVSIRPTKYWLFSTPSIGNRVLLHNYFLPRWHLHPTRNPIKEVFWPASTLCICTYTKSTTYCVRLSVFSPKHPWCRLCLCLTSITFRWWLGTYKPAFPSISMS